MAFKPEVGDLVWVIHLETFRIVQVKVEKVWPGTGSVVFFSTAKINGGDWCEGPYQAYPTAGSALDQVKFEIWDINGNEVKNGN